jgi:hypothetical protein
MHLPLEQASEFDEAPKVYAAVDGVNLPHWPVLE